MLPIYSKVVPPYLQETPTSTIKMPRRSKKSLDRESTADTFKSTTSKVKRVSPISILVKVHLDRNLKKSHYDLDKVRSSKSPTSHQKSHKPSILTTAPPYLYSISSIFNFHPLLKNPLNLHFIRYTIRIAS